MTFATHILVPTDFSEASRLGTDAAAMLAERFGAEVTLIHVQNDDALRPPANLGYIPERRAELAREIEVEVDAQLRALLETTFAKVEAKAVRVEDSSPARAICAHAEKVGADLIVIATHGRTGLKHLLIGSVAERVVRHASVPVLTLRSKAVD